MSKIQSTIAIVLLAALVGIGGWFIYRIESRIAREREEYQPGPPVVLTTKTFSEVGDKE